MSILKSIKDMDGCSRSTKVGETLVKASSAAKSSVDKVNILKN